VALPGKCGGERKQARGNAKPIGIERAGQAPHRSKYRLGEGWRGLCAAEACVQRPVGGPGMVFVPHWLGTEAITMFVVSALMMRLHNICSVVDFVLLGIERYEPMMVNDIQKLSRSNARAVDTSSKPMVTGGSTKKRKKRAQEASQPEPEPSPSDKDRVKLRTDRARRGELSEGLWWSPLYLTLAVALVLVVIITVSSVERCRRVAQPATDLSALLCLALVAMSTRYLLSFAYTGEAGTAEVRLLLKLGAAGFIFAACCNVFLDVKYLEFGIDHGARLLGVAVHSWMQSVAEKMPDYIPAEAMANLRAAPDTAGLQMAVTVALLPLLAAAWTVAIFFPGVRYGRLYSYISDRRNARLGYLGRLAHFYNVSAARASARARTRSTAAAADCCISACVSCDTCSWLTCCDVGLCCAYAICTPRSVTACGGSVLCASRDLDAMDYTSQPGPVRWILWMDHGRDFQSRPTDDRGDLRAAEDGPAATFNPGTVREETTPSRPAPALALALAPALALPS
jgi:hypothetical protein